MYKEQGRWRRQARTRVEGIIHKDSRKKSSYSWVLDTVSFSGLSTFGIGLNQEYKYPGYLW